VDTEHWQSARLIPTSGINGQDEAERRATSALLAVLHAVKEFRVAALKPLGAPAGVVECYIEVPFTMADERTVIPDGLLHVTRGKTAWTCLVEVKTGAAELQREQVENYLDVARDQGFNAVLARLAERSLAFGKPVLLTHGDSHYFRVDKPMFLPHLPTGVSALENFTRLENFGSPSVHWVEVFVDARDPEVFTVVPHIVKGNVYPR